jgi:WhiB family transcriptional regulator, redox-sensing transcriptional regulator
VRAELRTQVEQDWGDEAVCASEWVDPDWWFATADDPDHAAARTICGSCPVRRSCLAHALATNEPEGIWGGFDETERTWLRLALVESSNVAAILDPHTRTAAA